MDNIITVNPTILGQKSLVLGCGVVLDYGCETVNVIEIIYNAEVFESSELYDSIQIIDVDYHKCWVV